MSLTVIFKVKRLELYGYTVTPKTVGLQDDQTVHLTLLDYVKNILTTLKSSVDSFDSYTVLMAYGWCMPAGRMSVCSCVRANVVPRTNGWIYKRLFFHKYAC